MKRLLFDVEANGLLETATKVHCATVIDIDTEERWSFGPHQIDDFLALLSTADVIIGHNIIRYDLPLLRKLKKWEPTAGTVIRDTLVLARLIVPNVKDTDDALVRAGPLPQKMRGKHTIEAWGHRLGVPKGDYSQVRKAEALAQGITDEEAILRYTWSEYNEDMHAYMVQDGETNFALWKHLNVDKYSQQAIELEHDLAVICNTMEHAGVPFDMRAAGKLHAELIGRKAEVELKLVETFGFWFEPEKPSQLVFTPKVNNKTLGYVKDQPFCKLKKVTFNPGSRDHIAKVLLRRGWVPEKKTPGGKPMIDEEVVGLIVSRYPEMDGLAEYLMLDKRLGQLADGPKAWMKYVKSDGMIHGVINPMGTTTSRAAHMFPNLGQVPNAASPYGPECRGLFYAPPGWTIVGCDESGLELRGLAHFLYPMDHGKYAKVVLEGDVHWMHAQVMGLTSAERDKHNTLHIILREDGSKRFIYAYVYGAGDYMVGEIIHAAVAKAKKECGDTGAELYIKFFPEGPGERSLRRVGKRIRNSFATRIVGYRALQEKIADCVKRFGYLPGLDGRRIPVRSEHSALNFMIQSAGAIICKRWVVDSFKELSATFKYDWDNPWNGDFVLGLWVHDEVQVWCRIGLEEKIKEILIKNARTAGDPYGFRVPLDGEAKFGRTWAETH